MIKTRKAGRREIFGWAMFEMANGNLFWAIVFGAAGAVLFHALIMRGPDER